MDDTVQVLNENELLPETVAAELPVVPEVSEPEPAEPRAPSGMVLVAAIENSASGTDEPARHQVVEAVLFAATTPVAENRLREVCGCSAAELADAVGRLNREYEDSRRAFRIHRIAQGYQLYTLPEYSPWIRSLLKTHRAHRLSRASLETLAVIAYKQPITKPEIEQFRGVDATAPLLTLLERRLIVLAGRAHKPGNPFLYKTSKEFLRYFGLAGLDDLPRREELEEFLRHRDMGDEEETTPSGTADTPDAATADAPESVETAGLTPVAAFEPAGTDVAVDAAEPVEAIPEAADR